MVCNIFLVLFIVNINQSNKTPRKYLNFFAPPAARWNYPDLNNKSKRKIILIGDSYAEGSGDAWLNNKYNYSVGHFLIKNDNTLGIDLLSNGGSFLPNQIYLLKNAFKGKYLFSNKFTSYVKEKKSIDILAFFYEGNDLENIILNPDYEKFSVIKSIRRFNNKYFPIFHFIYAHLRNKYNKFLFYYGNNPDENTNRSQTDNIICREDECRKFPPMQSAAAGLNKNEIDNALNLTKNSIINFRNKYNAKICLIYIPSPATLYSPNSCSYQNYFPSKEVSNVSGHANKKKSEYIRSKFSSISNEIGIEFFDSTEYLKKFADNKFIHGKLDKKHFNSDGYKILSQFITPKINGCFNQLKIPN